MELCILGAPGEPAFSSTPRCKIYTVCVWRILQGRSPLHRSGSVPGTHIFLPRRRLACPHSSILPAGGSSSSRPAAMGAAPAVSAGSTGALALAAAKAPASMALSALCALCSVLWRHTQAARQSVPRLNQALTLTTAITLTVTQVTSPPSIRFTSSSRSHTAALCTRCPKCHVRLLTPAISEGCTRSIRISHSMCCIVPTTCV